MIYHFPKNPPVGGMPIIDMATMIIAPVIQGARPRNLPNSSMAPYPVLVDCRASHDKERCLHHGIIDQVKHGPGQSRLVSLTHANENQADVR